MRHISLSLLLLIPSTSLAQSSPFNDSFPPDYEYFLEENNTRQKADLYDAIIEQEQAKTEALDTWTNQQLNQRDKADPNAWINDMVRDSIRQQTRENNRRNW